MESRKIGQDSEQNSRTSGALLVSIPPHLHSVEMCFCNYQVLLHRLLNSVDGTLQGSPVLAEASPVQETRRELPLSEPETSEGSGRRGQPQPPHCHPTAPQAQVLHAPDPAVRQPAGDSSIPSPTPLLYESFMQTAPLNPLLSYTQTQIHCHL